MSTLFAQEIIESCLASRFEVDAAKFFGKKMQFNDENGKVTAYLWNDKTYITEIDILPEAFGE